MCVSALPFRINCSLTSVAAKYEFKLFRQRDTSATEVKVKPKVSSLSPSNSIDRSAVVAALLGPSQSAASRTSTISTLRPRNVSVSSGTASSTAVPPRTAPPVSSSLSSPDKLNPPASAPAFPSRLQDRSVSQPVSSSVSAGAQGQSTFGGSLTSSQSHTIDATLPLQVLTPTSAPLAIPSRTSYLSAPNPFHNLQANSAPPFQSTFGQTNGVSPSSISSGLSISPSYSGTNLSPFQSSSIGTTPLSTTPSPNSFSPQVLPNVTGANSFSVQNTMTGFAQQPQAPFSQPAQSPFGQPQTPFNQSSQTPYGQHSQSPFGQAALTGQQFGQQQIQAQPFAQQPQMQFAQPPQLQAQTPGNPYLQTPSPFTGAQQLSGSPSPFAQTQPLPQMNTMQQAQQQTGFGGTNPFTSWIQQPPAQQQGGYNQQWGM